MEVICNTPGDAIASIPKILLNYGYKSSPRGQDTLEILNFTIGVDSPWCVTLDGGVTGRNLRPYIGALEACQLVGQVAEPELMVQQMKSFRQFADHGVLAGAYGPRIYGQLGKVVESLGRDWDTRQAVLTFYDSKQDLLSDSLDIPCTVSMQFFIRGDKVHARTSMRSNDAYLGLPYDLIQFTALQGAVAAAMGLQMGHYVHTVGSMHLYAKDIEKASEMIDVSTYWDYVPLWGAGSIGEISSRARRLMTDDPNTTIYTRFENDLRKAIVRMPNA